MSGRLNIAFFASSLVSAYWNGAATYYRGIVRALHGRGHRVTFYEPDAFDRQKHRDLPDPDWAKVVVYSADGIDDVNRQLEAASDADLIIKASGVGVFDELLEAGVAALKRRANVIAFWDVDAPATLDRMHHNAKDPFLPLVPNYDLVLTYGGGDPVVRAYEKLGAKKRVPIYNALDPSTHHPVPPELRTGISWADSHLPNAKRWFDWQMDQLHRAGLKVLLSAWHTPPSISEGGTCNSPPKRLRDYADFIDRVITDYAGSFDALELWNEPSNRCKWNFTDFDPQWRKFGRMIVDAAYWARHRGQTTVLGGMIPVDPHWLALMESHGVLDHIDVGAIHAFPGMWWPGQPNWDWHSRWHGWEAKLNSLRDAAGGRPIWVTEAGLARWCLTSYREAKQDLQVKMLDEAVRAPAERMYWYSLIDLDPKREAIEGFHVDENEYHMGLVTFDGVKKDGYFRLRELLGSPAATTMRARTSARARNPGTPPAKLGLR